MHVGAAFEFDDFRTVYSYMRNGHDVFVLVMPVPTAETSLAYRIVVDGLWMPDPFNPLSTRMASGVALSRVEITDLPPLPLRSPHLVDDGTVEFNLERLPGRRVYLVGDFNNWDPFFHRLDETAAGTYSTRLRTYSGRHHYYFLVDGRRILDPLNPATAVDAEGAQVSTFLLP